MIDGLPAAYLDGPGGTQAPQRVIDAVTDYLANHNCNVHGAFVTCEESDATIQDAQAPSPTCSAATGTRSASART